VVYRIQKESNIIKEGIKSCGVVAKAISHSFFVQMEKSQLVSLTRYFQKYKLLLINTYHFLLFLQVFSMD